MTTRTWSFFRAGGVDQVKLTSGADLASLHQLDQKLWVSLACPAKGIEFDARTLELMDGDKDGRIRAPELVAGGLDGSGAGVFLFLEPILKGIGDFLQRKQQRVLFASHGNCVSLSSRERPATDLSATEKPLDTISLGARGPVLFLQVRDSQGLLSHCGHSMQVHPRADRSRPRALTCVVAQG